MLGDMRDSKLVRLGALAVLVFGIASAPAQQADSSALELRLQRLEDEARIRRLMMEYGRRLDTRDWEAFAQLFAVDGEWSGNIDGGFVTIRGRERIRAAMEKAFAQSPYDPANVASVHVIDNISIEVRDDGRATGTSRWTVLARGADNAPWPRMTGRYEDVFVKENGEWKFLSRAAPRDIPPQGNL